MPELVWTERKSDLKYTAHVSIRNFLILEVEQWRDAEAIGWSISTCSDSGFENVELMHGVTSTTDQAKIDAVAAAAKLLLDALQQLDPTMIVMKVNHGVNLDRP
jgi:hypothetical protein